MGLLFYAYKDRYLFTGTVRRAGFSGFGSARKIGVFPSFALAWVMSEKNFFGNTLVNHLTLRGSSGVTARRPFERFQTVVRMASQHILVFASSGTNNTGMAC